MLGCGGDYVEYGNFIMAISGIFDVGNLKSPRGVRMALKHCPQTTHLRA